MAIRALRFLLLTSVVFGLFSMALAKPVARATPKTEAKPAAMVQAKPLSPAQLNGKVVYVLGNDVWAIDPQTQQKFLLYKDLFFPTDAADSTYYFSSEGTGNQHPFATRDDIAWSLDRTQIAFARRKINHPGAELFVMNWDGTHLRQLSHENYDLVAFSPIWNPDGKTIAFMWRVPNNMGPRTPRTLAVISSEDGKTVPLATENWPMDTLSSPRWSRDGRQLLVSYSPPNMEDWEFKSEEEKAAILKVSGEKLLMLDGSPPSAYSGDHHEFLQDDQSPDGKWVLTGENSIAGTSRWQLRRFDQNWSQDIIWDSTGGFFISRFCLDNQARKFVFAGSFLRRIVGSKGVINEDQVNGIFFYQLQNDTMSPLRLLVKDAQLVDYFSDWE